jgi:hypothetical protein
MKGDMMKVILMNADIFTTDHETTMRRGFEVIQKQQEGIELNFEKMSALLRETALTENRFYFECIDAEVAATLKIAFGLKGYSEKSTQEYDLLIGDEIFLLRLDKGCLEGALHFQIKEACTLYNVWGYLSDAGIM